MESFSCHLLIRYHLESLSSQNAELRACSTASHSLRHSLLERQHTDLYWGSSPSPDVCAVLPGYPVDRSYDPTRRGFTASIGARYRNSMIASKYCLLMKISRLGNIFNSKHGNKLLTVNQKFKCQNSLSPSTPGVQRLR